ARQRVDRQVSRRTGHHPGGDSDLRRVAAGGAATWTVGSMAASEGAGRAPLGGSRVIFLAVSFDTEVALWTIAVSCVCGVACAVHGCCLVLNRMCLRSEAIGHGMLPGIALAVLFVGHIDNMAILVGAMLCGVLTALLTQALTSVGRVPEDAAMGVVFTTF